MQTNVSPSNTQPSSTRPLWAAVGILGVAVAALGGTLIGMQLGGGAAAASVALSPAAVTQPAAGLVPLDLPATAPAHANVVRAPERTAPAPVVEAAAARAPTVQATRCDDCGTVLSVSPVRRDGYANGIGAVAGAVAGGVVGNQVGGGSGRAVATVLGALGGGWAGNTVEKKVRQTTAYVTRVRMADGSVRTLEQVEPLAIGSPVLVRAGVARVAHQQNRALAVRG